MKTPEITDKLYSLKWELSDDQQQGSTFNFQFESDSAPMWGDIFAKNGGNLSAINAGYYDTPADLSDLEAGYQNWVLVPDTQSAAPIPEHGTMLLFGAGLLGLIGIRRRKLPFTS